jgi:cell division inhibitor SulA
MIASHPQQAESGAPFQPVFSLNRQAEISHPPVARITRWMVGENGAGALIDYKNLLLPLLSWQTHHNEKRWVTWMASQFIDKRLLQKFNVNLASLRMIVDTQSQYSSFKLLTTALKNKRSGMVVASLPSLDEKQRQELEWAAEQGNCQGIILIHE